MSAPPRRGVPAVDNALRILDLLRAEGNEPRTMSEIARTTSINASTCFNILKTLEAWQVVSFDPSTKTYRLGLYLADLAAVVDEQRETRRQALEEARRISEAAGLGCFLMTLSEREEFVVLDKVESRHPIRVTIDVGATFPVTGAVAAKAWFAWEGADVVADVIQRYGLPAYTSHSVTDPGEFEHELAVVRERSWSTSVGEYYPDHNAVASAVFGWDARPRYLLVVVGAASRLSGDEMARVGEEVAAGAERATKRIGGRHPGWVGGDDEAMEDG